jgi:hypothetical protein
VTHPRHAQNVTVDNVVNTFVIFDISETPTETIQHANVIDQNTNLQLAQFLFESDVDSLAIGKVYSDRFHLDRTVFVL